MRQQFLKDESNQIKQFVIYNQMSFLFSCCREDSTSNQYYQVQKQEGAGYKTQYVRSFEDIKNKDQAFRILKVQRSNYDQLNKKHGPTNKWSDPTFPHDSKSLGNIPNIPIDSKWKRLSEILDKPQLFQKGITPQDIIQGNLGDCYFLSALSALAEKHDRILKVFGKQQYNPAGIYKVTLRIDGVIQQILIDDYVPINESNKPLFSQPKQSQMWVVLLEKAWAKAHGSYANINSGTPSEVFKAITYAPSELIPVKSDNVDQLQYLWKQIKNGSIRDNPICCGTSKDNTIDWKGIGLVQGHAYSLLDAIQIKDQSSNTHRILKLRNPWGHKEWNGAGNQNDHAFWSRIPTSPEKTNFLEHTNFGNDGLFFIQFTDFIKYFNEVHVCNLIQNAAYESQQLHADGKHGSIYSLNVSQQDNYIIQLHQSSLRSDNEDRVKDGLNRSTLLLAKGSNFQFIDGSLKYNQEDNSLKVHLTPGQYYLYGKIDPTLTRGLLPESIFVSSYSSNHIDFTPIDHKLHPDFFKKVFLPYARNNKRKQFDNGLLWLSYKLLFEKGGFAYIAFGVDAKSQKKFKITINESDFLSLGYVLKKPHKRKGHQVLEIKPGQQEIVVARVKNAPLQTMKFPPPMDIQIEHI